MRIDSSRDSDNRTARLLVSVDERDLLLFREEVTERVRSELAKRLADLVWLEIEPRLKQALK